MMNLYTSVGQCMFHRCVFFIQNGTCELEWSAIELSIKCRIGDREVTFMTNYNQQMAGLKSAKAKQLQEQYGKNELAPQKKAFYERSFISFVSRCFYC